MSNINDYLKWRGDIPFSKEFPFNEVDSMILARFSYLLFNKININEKETIKSISEKMKSFKNEDFLYNGDKELITNLGESNRYKNLIVTDFEENNEKENEKQFSAIVIHTGKKEIYISYIGTNSTLYGWKEDFNMAFMDNVPCQIAGKNYLEKIAKKYKNKKIRLGGHSKGGNVAIYSAITVDKMIQKRIIKVYNYDGPGFNQKTIEKYSDSNILEKIETYFPQESIIGRLMNHKEKCSIVLSIEKGILQHDIYSWQVLGDKITYTSQMTKSSEILNNTLTTWLADTTPEQRRIFVDTIFELFFSTNLNTFGEISRNITKTLPIIFRKYNEVSVEDRKILTEMIKLFIKNYFDEMIKIERKQKTEN